MIEEVIQHLRRWQSELSLRSSFPSIQEKADHIGLINAIDLSVQWIQLCETHGIYPSAWICTLPEVANPAYQPDYRVVNDGESDKPGHWLEVEFPDRGKVRLSGGDLVIKK